jgi:cell shape-determining protein MreD
MTKRKKSYNNFIAIGLVFLSLMGSSVSKEFSIKLDFNQFFNLSYLLIYFFSFYRFRFFSIFSMFVLGLISDSITGIPFGVSSVAYMLIFRIAVYQNSIRLRSMFLAEWFAFAIAIFVTYIIILIIFYSTSRLFDYEVYIYNFLGTVLMYPFTWLILKYFFLKLEKITHDE